MGFILNWLSLILTLSIICYANAETSFKVCDMSQEKYKDHCLNNGICYNLLLDGKIDEKQIFCSCSPEYTGKRCEEILIRPTFMPFLKSNQMNNLNETLKEAHKNAKSNIFISQRSLGLSQINSEYCSNVNCKSGEICKYFDSNMYRCPEEKMDCSKFKKATKIPICVKTNVNDACIDSLKMGNCSTYKERFYYDAVDRTCKKFYYTGCNGNRNNFHTLSECSQVCSPRVEMSKKIKNNSPKVASFARKSLNNVKEAMSFQPKPVNKCEFSCSLNCPFGFKLNYRTNCPKCECSPLKMTECGVPCFTVGTKSCAFSMRANSRPNCDCKNSYDGVYCHIYTKSANFTVELDQRLILNDALRSEIRYNLKDMLSELLVVGTKSVTVNEVNNDLYGKVVIKFNVRAAEFSTPNEFENMAQYLKYKLNDNLQLKIREQNYNISQSKSN